MKIQNEPKIKERKNNVHKIIQEKFDLKLEEISKFKIVSIIFIINIMILFIIYFLKVKISENNLENYEQEVINNNILLVDNTIEKESQKIKVHITGEIKMSGLYELDEESRISDAIEKAGGVTPDADLSKINLAYKLSDGQKIIIPSIKQEDIGNYIIEDSGEDIIENNENKETKININTATIQELTTLSGIGESTAQKIIDYREQNGKFKNIEDIKNVSGIGDSKYNQIRDYIKVK